MDESAFKEYRERHRERYVALLERIVKARELPDEERAKHQALYDRLLMECASERARACGGFMGLDDLKPVDPRDPLLRDLADRLGTIEEIAIGLVEARRALVEVSGLEEVLGVLGEVSERIDERDSLKNAGACEVTEEEIAESAAAYRDAALVDGYGERVGI